MFPFRRGTGGTGGGKKRSRGAGQNRRQGGRRVPGSASELLPMLQPATKALAQVLAGNTKASGQLVHARNIVEQADRLLEDRAVDRLPPAQREEFAEQLARLKLTLADAEAFADGTEEDEPETPATSAPVSMERLRALALSLAEDTSKSRPSVDNRPAETAAADDAAPADPAAPEAASSAAGTKSDASPSAGEGGATPAGESSGAAPAGKASGSGRGRSRTGERLRLKMNYGDDEPTPKSDRVTAE